MINTDKKWEENEEEELINTYKNIRKSTILEKLPLEEWTKEEILDLISEYDIYVHVFNKTNKEITDNIKPTLPIVTFIKSGKYQRLVNWLDIYKKE